MHLENLIQNRGEPSIMDFDDAAIGWFDDRPEHDGSEYFQQIRQRVVDARSALS